MPVHDGDKIHKAVSHGNVGDISSPNLIGMIDGQVPEQIWINPVLWMRPTCMWLRVDGFYAHQPHQSLDVLTIDLTALSTEMSRKRSTAVRRCLHVLLINQAHQFQVFGFDRLWFVVI